MPHTFTVEVGPIGLRVVSAWPGPIAKLRDLYADYPLGSALVHYTARLDAPAWHRRWLRPAIHVEGDFMLPDAAPLPLRLGLLAAEMAMNMQVALGERRFLLLHAATVERDGRAMILTGESGSGKSTLAALLGESGWRLMGDEFALLEPETGRLHPFPRPISLKNQSIALLADTVNNPVRFGPLLTDTPKGTIRHFLPRAQAIAGMGTTAPPALIVFPRFGQSADQRPVPASEAFIRLTQASTNYALLGDRGFAALSHLVKIAPAVAIDYPDSRSVRAMIDALWNRPACAPRGQYAL